MADLRVAIVLPPFCRYRTAGATSIDLYARDTVRYSAIPDITVIGPECDDPFADGGTYVGVAARGEWSRHVLRALRTIAPDVVEVHQDVNLAGWLARHLDVPVTVIRHNAQKLPRGALRRWFKRRQWRRIAAFAFVSEFLRRDFAAALPAFAPRCHVLYNGIDPDAWAAPLDGRERLVAFVGRLVPEKGLAPLIEAGRSVLSRHPEWRFLFLRGDPSNEDAATAALVAEFARDFPGRVRVEGPLPHAELPGRLGRVAIAVVPSLWPEPFGRTAIEAMAAGCTLIASARGGLREIVDETVAHVVEPPSADLIADALFTLIEDPDGRAVLAAAGRDLVAERFALARCIAAVDNLRRGLAGRIS
ncbi:MAG: glycosyltransferase family 4 protein [Zavarzinia sp.]|nr:glycosyltransferase family 4 protein [Zavarzinia sp.]